VYNQCVTPTALMDNDLQYDTEKLKTTCHTATIALENGPTSIMLQSPSVAVKQCATKSSAVAVIADRTACNMNG